MNPLIEVTDLKKSYDTITAVDGVSFEVGQGEIFGLLGPNGAGKTTTIEMMEGLREMDAGEVRVGGYSVSTDKKWVRAMIGVQLQSTSLFDLLKVKEILKLYASFYAQSLPVDTILEQMNLTQKSNDLIKGLSGGQKQRLAIGLALIHDPQMIFLDEPTTGLDPQARRSLWEIIRSLQEQGKTVLLSTHYMEEAHVLCDRLAIMDNGQIIALDTPDQLIASLEMEGATLEDVFLQLTGRSLREE